MEPTLEKIFKETKCPVCGKNFCRGTQWAYKGYNYKKERWIYFCSWKCLREAEAKEEPKTRKRIAVDQLNLEGQLLNTFDTIDDAAAQVNGLYNGIRYACKKNLKYKGYLWRYNTDDLSKVQRTDTSD